MRHESQALIPVGSDQITQLTSSSNICRLVKRFNDLLNAEEPNDLLSHRQMIKVEDGLSILIYSKFTYRLIQPVSRDLSLINGDYAIVNLHLYALLR